MKIQIKNLIIILIWPIKVNSNKKFLDGGLILLHFSVFTKKLVIFKLIHLNVFELFLDLTLFFFQINYCILIF